MRLQRNTVLCLNKVFHELLPRKIIDMRAYGMGFIEMDFVIVYLEFLPFKSNAKDPHLNLIIRWSYQRITGQNTVCFVRSIPFGTIMVCGDFNSKHVATGVIFPLLVSQPQFVDFLI